MQPISNTSAYISEYEVLAEVTINSEILNAHAKRGFELIAIDHGTYIFRRRRLSMFRLSVYYIATLAILISAIVIFRKL